MSKSPGPLVTLIGPILNANGFIRRRQLWYKTFPEVCVIVEILRRGGLVACYTVEFGVIPAPAESLLRLTSAYAILRERWGTFLTNDRPWTDWWVGFDNDGPFLTASCDDLYQRLGSDDLRRAVSERIVPLLDRYTTLSDIERVIDDKRDWITGVSRSMPPPAMQWYERQLSVGKALQAEHRGVGELASGAEQQMLQSIVVESVVLDHGRTLAAQAGDFIITLGDQLAHECQENVQSFVTALGEFPGVVSARQDDRELIRGWGHPDLVAMRSWLLHWWALELAIEEP
jgi:hypothetical protein